MSEPFDPYYMWLGIPPEEQPPNHYRLLAIRLFESNAEVIENAADRLMAHLRTYQIGKNSALSQKLLNEAAAAKVSLFDPQKKAAYDAWLRQQLMPASPQPAPPQDAIDPALIGLHTRSTGSRPVVLERRRRDGPWFWPAVLGSVCVVLLVGLLVFPRRAPPKTALLEKPKVTRPVEPPVQAKTEPAKGTDRREEPKPAPEPQPAKPEMEPPSAPAEAPKAPDAAPAPVPTTSPSLPAPLAPGAGSSGSATTAGLPRTARRIRQFQGHRTPAICVAFSSDGRRAVSGGVVSGRRQPDGKIERQWDPIFVWDVETGQPGPQFAGHGQFAVPFAQFLPDGQHVLSVASDGARIWDAATGREVRNFGLQRVNPPVALSLDTRLLLSRESRTSAFGLWDVATGQAVRQFSVSGPSSVSAMAWSPDGRWAVFACGDKSLRVVEVSTGAQVRTLEDHQERISSVAFSPDGRYLLSSGGEYRNGRDFAIRLWDFVGGSVLRRLEGHSGPVYRLVWSPNGRRAFSRASQDGAFFWDTENGRLVGRFPGMWVAAFSPDGRRAIGGSQTLELWDLGDDAGPAATSPPSIVASPSVVPAPIVSAPVQAPVAAVPTAEQKPVPSAEAQAAARAAVKQTFQKQYAQTGSASRLALAAVLVEKGRQWRDRPAEQYVCLCEARDLAAQEEDHLALLAIDELATRFKVPGATAKLELIGQWIKRARTPGAVGFGLEAASAMERDLFGSPDFETLADFFRELDLVALKKTLPVVVARIQEKRKRLDALRPLSEEYRAALAAQAKDPSSAQAAVEVGRMVGLVLEDWKRALPLLARGAAGPLSAAATKLAARPDDFAARLAMADALWDLSAQERSVSALRPMMRQAAGSWYEQALPGLSGGELERVQSRLSGEAAKKRAGKSVPFGIPLHGLVSVAKPMTPARVSGLVSPVGGFATIGGRATIEYPPVAASCYVHEMGIVLSSVQSYFHFRYGDPADCLRLHFSWDSSKRQFECHTDRYTAGSSYMGTTQSLPSGKPVRITLAVNEGKCWLLIDEAQVPTIEGAPSDLKLVIDSGSPTSLVITRCEFRPWGAGDTARFGCPPPRKFESHWGETALRLHARNADLADRPTLPDGKPFVIPTTGTVMQWIPAGSFSRRNPYAQNNQSTQFQISHGFWLSRYEITQGQWMTLMATNPSRIGGSPFLPVESVRWDDAMNWCAALGQSEAKARRLPQGYEYRLPTEAEWEYAARAGAAGDTGDPQGGCWSADNSDWRLHEVGEGQPSNWGLYDTGGNASEWCLDGWQDIGNNPILRVVDPFYRNRDPKQVPFVVRGGGWHSPRFDCTLSSRRAGHGLSGGHRGFRLALAPTLK